MRFPRKRGTTSVKCRVFIPDNSVTTGAGCTGLTYTSTNLAVAYSRENDNGGTEVTGANLLDITTIGTWVDPGAGKVRFKAVDATKLPGVYEIHFPDAAAFGTGDTSQNIIINIYEKTTTALKIGPNMVLIPLSKVNPLDGESDLVAVLATAPTEGGAGRLAAGLTKLFDVATPVLTSASVNQTGDTYTIANSGTFGNSALKTLLDAITGYIDTEVAAILADTNELQTDLVNGGRLDLLIDAIKAKTDDITFSTIGANKRLNATVKAINQTEITGDGTTTPWGPA